MTLINLCDMSKNVTAIFHVKYTCSNFTNSFESIDPEVKVDYLLTSYSFGLSFSTGMVLELKCEFFVIFPQLIEVSFC